MEFMDCELCLDQELIVSHDVISTKSWAAAGGVRELAQLQQHGDGWDSLTYNPLIQ